MSRSTSEEEIILNLLTVVHSNSRTSQRSLARELDIALGLANTYLRRCVKKGYVKVRAAPANRFLYYLTPTGFTEKSRLTASYLSRSFNFFREARQQGIDLITLCQEMSWENILLVGPGDFAEILTLCVHESPVKILDTVPVPEFVSDDGNLTTGDIIEGIQPDALIVSDIANPQSTFDSLCEVFPEGKILTAPFLNISRQYTFEKDEIA